MQRLGEPPLVLLDGPPVAVGVLEVQEGGPVLRRELHRLALTEAEILRGATETAPPGADRGSRRQRRADARRPSTDHRPHSVARAAPDTRPPHVTRTASHTVAGSQASPRRSAPAADRACGTPTGSRVPRRARVRGGARCAGPDPYGADPAPGPPAGHPLTPGRAHVNHPRAVDDVGGAEFRSRTRRVPHTRKPRRQPPTRAEAQGAAPRIPPRSRARPGARAPWCG